jgi:hypothetical protein
VEFEPTIPVFEQAEAFLALDHAATVIGDILAHTWIVYILRRNFLFVFQDGAQ